MLIFRNISSAAVSFSYCLQSHRRFTVCHLEGFIVLHLHKHLPTNSKIGASLHKAGRPWGFMCVLILTPEFLLLSMEHQTGGLGNMWHGLPKIALNCSTIWENDHQYIDIGGCKHYEEFCGPQIILVGPIWRCFAQRITYFRWTLTPLPAISRFENPLL